jgi:hypothetical protein
VAGAGVPPSQLDRVGATSDPFGVAKLATARALSGTETSSGRSDEVPASTMRRNMADTHSLNARVHEGQRKLRLILPALPHVRHPRKTIPHPSIGCAVHWKKVSQNQHQHTYAQGGNWGDAGLSRGCTQKKLYLRKTAVSPEP